MPETLLNIEEVAAQLTVSTRTVRRMMDIGELKAFRIGKRWRFTQSEIDCYIKRQQAEEEPPDLVVEQMNRIESPGYNELGEDEPMYVHPDDR